jgi:hypothetical protein
MQDTHGLVVCHGNASVNPPRIVQSGYQNRQSNGTQRDSIHRCKIIKKVIENKKLISNGFFT